MNSINLDLESDLAMLSFRICSADLVIESVCPSNWLKMKRYYSMRGECISRFKMDVAPIQYKNAFSCGLILRVFHIVRKNGRKFNIQIHIKLEPNSFCF